MEYKGKTTHTILTFLWKYKASFIAAISCTICLSCAYCFFLEKQIASIQTQFLSEYLLGLDDIVRHKVVLYLGSEIRSRFLIVGIVLVILASFIPLLLLRFKRDNSESLSGSWKKYKNEPQNS